MLVNPYRFKETTEPIGSIPFIFKVNSGSDGKFSFRTNPSYIYDYNLITSDGQTILNQTGNYEITFPNTNTDYIIEITGVFPHMYYVQNKYNILDVLQWGNQPWVNMEYMFHYCQQLFSFSATDTPDLSNVTYMRDMFSYSSFNGDIGGWDVSDVADTSYMFSYSSFNGDIGGWDVSNVWNMRYMFGYSPFNQDISGWDVSKVTNMSYMFTYATSFNQDLSSWCVQNMSSNPANFDWRATSWTLPKPVWGTCPP